MYTPFLLLLTLLPLCNSNKKQQNKDDFRNTIRIENTDTPEIILHKAAHVVPTQNQMAALENEFIAFIHFGPNTFTRMEWGNGMEDPQIFDLKNLNTDQWCEAIQAAGMKMVLLTVKHHDGFVLWQSRYTRHGIMSSGFKNGKGDILKDLSESCRKYNLKLGVYLSPADLYQIENPKGLYGNQSKTTLRTIPREVKGRPFANPTKFEFKVDDYNEYFLNQLYEILTEYGPVDEVWFDGAHPKTKGGQKYNYTAWKKLIKTLVPNAVIFGREDIRWCGNESGGTRKTEWNVIPFHENPDTTSNFPDLTNIDLGSRNELLKGKFLHYQQAETNTSIREGWFYRDDTHQKVRSVDDVFDIYERAVGGNSTFLLNIPPNRDGVFSEKDVTVLQETGKRIHETYNTNLLTNARGPKEILDNKKETYLLITDANKNLIITTPSPITFNRFMIQEAIDKNGERVEKHALDIWENGAWKEVANATNIGYKRILRFPEKTTDKIRVRFLESRLTPAIAAVSAHYYKARPPQLDFKRNLNGMVTIEPRRQDFNWKSHGEDVVRNLNAGYEIYYTTNGQQPTRSDNKYTEPFQMEKGELKAFSILNKQQGSCQNEYFGLIKKEWQLLNVSSAVQQNPATLAFDENPATYWSSQANDSQKVISIDLQKKQPISGFAYTPQKDNSEGMMAKGYIEISNDGKNWSKITSFEFGNLINNPVKRVHYFKQEVSARYIKITATEIAGKSNRICIAEIDFL